MRDECFVNIAVDNAMKSYLISSKDSDSILFNSFYVVVIRALILIYGKDIVEAYNNKNSVLFMNILSKYGMSVADAAVFKEEFLNFFNFEEENSRRKIKLKNPYFKVVLKYLVDMFATKKKKTSINYIEEEEFLDLIYTTHTKNPYRISYNYLMSDDIMYSEKYYYSRINELDITRDLSDDLGDNLNLKALEYVGVNLSNLKDMSNSETEQAKINAYEYFDIDVNSPTRDKELEEQINALNNLNNKVTTGNGYVDILLLMSVIATSFSVLAILVFSLI